MFKSCVLGTISQKVLESSNHEATTVHRSNARNMSIHMALSQESSVSSVVRNLLEQVVQIAPSRAGFFVESFVRYYAGALLESQFGNSSDVVTHRRLDNWTPRLGACARFRVGGFSVLATAHPGDVLCERIEVELECSQFPVVYTQACRVEALRYRLSDFGLINKVDVFSIEEVTVMHVLNHSKFQAHIQDAILARVAANYNKIIEEIEASPRLLIEIPPTRSSVSSTIELSRQ